MLHSMIQNACDNKPLYELFCDGAFNSLSESDLNECKRKFNLQIRYKIEYSRANIKF